MSVHIAFETPQDVQEQVYEMVKSLGKDGKGRLKKGANEVTKAAERGTCLLYTSPSPRDQRGSRMPSSA